MVSIIILNWNNAEDTKRCLDSLTNLVYRQFEVVLVDNGSEQDAVVGLEAWIDARRFSYPVRLVKEPRNLGFAGGNIRGLRECRGEYIVLLNNDVVVHSAWLGALVAAAERDDKIFAVGSKMFKWDERNEAYNTGNEFWAYQDVDPDTAHSYPFSGEEAARYADFVYGSAMLLNRKLLPCVGFLDPEFFAYYEETDLLARAKRLGFKTRYEPQAMVWHKTGATSRRDPYFLNYQLHKNRAVFAIRNFDEPRLRRFIKAYTGQSLRSGVAFLFKGGMERKARLAAFFWGIIYLTP